MTMGRSLPIIMGLILVMLLPGVGFSQTPTSNNNVLDSIIDLYRANAGAWRTTIVDAATRLFWILVGIDFVWTGINLGLQKADFSQIVAELIKRIFVIGFYYALLLNSGAWSSAIIDSFRKLASDVNYTSSGLSGGITPSNIFDIGIRIAAQLTEQVSFSEIGESVGRVIISIIILISFALIAGFLLVALIELYIALNAAVILLGFGGSRWTSDYAVRYLSFVFSIGMKIFVMQLLIGIGQSFILSMNTIYNGNMDQTLILLGVSIVLCLLVKQIPDYIQSVVSGVSPGSAGNALIAASSSAGGSALGVATGGATVGIGGAMAVMEAAKLAKAGSSAGMGGALMGAGRHLGSAALGDIGGKLSGNISHQHGTMGARMASRLKEERLSMPPREAARGSSSKGTEGDAGAGNQ